jgi:hypothetical protein
MLVRPMGSFDTGSGSYPGDVTDQHQVQMMSGGNPILMTMGMPGIPPSSSQENYPSSSIDSPESSTPSHRPSGTMSPFPLGKMNPDATSFSPSYLAAAQGK